MSRPSRNSRTVVIGVIVYVMYVSHRAQPYIIAIDHSGTFGVGDNRDPFAT